MFENGERRQRRTPEHMSELIIEKSGENVPQNLEFCHQFLRACTFE